MLDWLYTAIAWVMKSWHALFSTLLDPASGIAWALSIAFLVITIRLLLFRLFVKQVKSQRAMQEIQPEIQKLRRQYGADKQGFSQAMMAMQKERGVNPLAGCLPILPQIPVFIALFHVLRRIAPGKQGLYSWSDELTQQAAVAELFGAPISSSFNMDGSKEEAILQIASYTNIRVVAFALMVIMCLTTFYTQKQIMRRSGPVEGQAAMVQKLLLYGMPLSLFASGFFFPIGVLLYWFTNNLWTLGQQFYILKKLPPPGAAGKTSPERTIDPKALAPKPGVKPVRPRNRPTGSTSTSSAPGSTAADGDSPVGASPEPPGVGGNAAGTAAELDGAGSGEHGPRSAKGRGGRGTRGATAAGASASGVTASGSGPTDGALDRPGTIADRPRKGSGGRATGATATPGGGRSDPSNRSKRKRR